MRRVIRFKNLLILDLPNDFILFKQYNIVAKQIFLNLLAFHSIVVSNQETIMMEDIYGITDVIIYGITDSLQTSFLPEPKKGAPASFLEVTHNGLHWPPQDEEFIIFLQEDGWSLGSFQAYNDKTDSITLQCLKSLKTRVQDNRRKTYWKMLNCCNVSMSWK